ncbi:non-ribosomal peptide synthetase [Virgibacillus pantothenticus]|uniref:non-ribosomal peptide synthetase n=2 Tax=Virgibacillus pantothenticus TaxID=1473 RepID=UPI000987B7E0|nr:non-ribosomal peptide synthetase [Virgibacillus pantothenticus]
MKVVDSKEGLLLMLDTHHVVSDGMSAGTFLHELTALYNGKNLPEPELQYKDYSEWIRTRDLSEQKLFWLEQFEKDIPVLNLPLDFTRPQTQSYQGAKVVKEVPVNIVESIKTLSKGTDTTEYMVLLSALMITLSKYARQEDIVVGSPISGRMHKDTENMMGMFVNTLAMRGRPSGDKRYREFLEELKEMALKAYENQEYPFEELVEELDIRRDMSRNPLFDVLFVLQNNEEVKVQLAGVESEYIESNDTVAKFDLTFNVGEYDERYIIELEYASALFKEETAQGILNHYVEVIKKISKDIEKEIRDIEITTEEEKTRILGEFNDTYVEYPKNKTIVDLFEEQVEKTPNNVAVVFEDEQLTYEELNKKANKVAHHLRGLGVRANDMVAMVTERSIEMIVGIYGILKAGGAYVPIDPSYPKNRIDFILSDCNPKAVLTYRTEVTTTIPILDLTDRKVLVTRDDNPEKLNSSNDLAYVIYTSGTTGQPKGVMIEHKSVVNFCVNNSNNILSKAIANKCRNIYLNNNIIFDIVLQEIQLPLSHGLTVIISSGNSNSFNVLKGTKDIGLILTPTKMKMYLDSADFRDILRQTSLIMLGAEEFDITSYHELKKYTSAEVYNGYGPTETTCGVLYYQVKSEKYIPIGKPINNTEIYILNENSLCGIGMPGELCIAGDGLARGYVNRPELTEEKFIDNPFGEGKLYRSGDLAKWLPDGNIEYLGRIDEQVKIRGYRIELGEVESVIRKQKGIKGVAVVAREKDGDKHLCAYVVAEGTLDIGELKELIGKELPEYMVPGYMMQIEKLPVTRNGKLDKGALPEMEIVSTKEYIGPRNEKEAIITGIFEEILELDKVSVNESFFELGGHSLRAMRLVNRIESETGARIPLRHVFSSPTVEKLAKLVKEDEGTKKIPKVEEKEYYPMSSTQKRTYVLQEMDDNSIAYNMPYTLQLNGHLDINRLKNAFEQMIERHEVLRTSLFMKDGEPVQKVNRTYKVDFEYVQNKISDLDELQREFVRPFDLTRGKVIRMKVVDSKEGLLLMLDTHHVVSDGMSAGTFLHELTALYNGKNLPEPELQYKDYSEWIRTRDLSEQKLFWLEQFEKDIPVLNLPLDFTRPQTQSYQGAKVVKEVPVNIVESIKTLSKGTDTTEYMVLLSALMITLSKYARQEDIVVGSPISGRMHKDTENMMGMFVNTLAMRGRPSGDKRYREFLEELKEMALKAYENQEYPFEELVEELDIRRDMSRNPLFDVLFVLQNNEEVKVQLAGVESEYIESNDTVAKFDLTFNVGEYDERYIIELEYASALFKEETAQGILNHYVEVIKKISKDIEKEIRDIEITTEEEKTRILGEFNDTYVEYPKNKTIVDLFEEQVEKTPNNVAVVFEDEQLTYEELNKKANKVAHHLRGLGVRANDMVAMVTERSIEMIVGIYGILKAGGAYVPIDPSYPKNRIDFILSDCNPKAVLTYRTEVTTTIPILDLTDRKVLGTRDDNPEKLNSSDDLAYVIYTSGTTGQPKGVMNQHSGIVNLITWLQAKYPINENDAIMLKTTYVFDVSASEIFFWSGTGARLEILTPHAEKDPELLLRAIEEKGITVINFVPSMLSVFLSSFSKKFKGNTSLRYVLAAGEALSPKLARDFSELTNKYISEVKLINLYGPTEATIFSTYYNCLSNDKSVPIGKPINNVKIYILNENSLCGIGMPGELCIVGDGLAKGYVNRPELTEEKFIDNPFGEGKLYRSGDLAKWLPDGNIEYLGRIDEQVKIRGYRIELGEVESVVRKQKGIKGVAVVAREKDGDKHLCAYVVAEGTLDIGELKELIGKELPEYMVPGYMMQIEKLPVTRNGKLDKGALPEMEIVSTKEYIGPRNEKEAIITGIFEEILELDKVSVNESFFELGGDSIKAIRIVSKIREMGFSVTVKDVMTEKTIEKLSSVCSKTTNCNNYTQGAITGEIGFTPIMLMFAEQDMERPEYFNQSVMIKSKEFNKESLKASLKKLVEHHDMLRAVYRNKKLYVGSIDKRELYSYSEHKVPYKTKEEIEKYITQKGTEVQKSINLQDGPLMKTALFQTNCEEHLLIVIHHLAIDGVSWRILLEDLETGYKQYLKEKKITLPSKTASFQDWSEALKEYTKSEKFEKEKVYWESIIADANDGNIHGQLNEPRRIETIEVVSDRTVTKKLVYEAGKAYNTEINDLLLTALAKAVNSVTNQTKISVKMEGHGREELHKVISVDRTVGWFTSEYPIVLKIGADLRESIIKTKEMFRNIPNNGIGYGLAKYFESSGIVEKGIDVCFNYLGNLSEGKRTKEKLIIPSEYYGGKEVSDDNKLAHPLTINGHLNNGELHFTMKYDAGKYSRKFVNRLMEEYKNSLSLIVDHCVKNPVNI